MNIHKDQKYLTRTQIQPCLEWILGLMKCFAFHDHHQWKSHEILCKKMKEQK